MIPLVIGTALALAALAYVLAPIFLPPSMDRRPLRDSVAASRGDGLDQEVDALREIEFDHATGKLSDTDYAALQSEYTTRAVRALRTERRAARVCPSCGPRPEPEAAYCSACGAPLAT